MKCIKISVFIDRYIIHQKRNNVNANVGILFIGREIMLMGTSLVQLARAKFIQSAREYYIYLILNIFSPS